MPARRTRVVQDYGLMWTARPLAESMLARIFRLTLPASDSLICAHENEFSSTAGLEIPHEHHLSGHRGGRLI